MEPFDFDELKSAQYSDYIDRKESCFRELSPEPAEQYVDLFWARLIPYQVIVSPGDEVSFIVLLRNNYPDSREFEARLILPRGWEASTETGKIKLTARSAG